MTELFLQGPARPHCRSLVTTAISQQTAPLGSENIHRHSDDR